VLGKRRSLSIFRTPSTAQKANIYLAVAGPALALVAVLVGVSGSVTTSAGSARAPHSAAVAATVGLPAVPWLAGTSTRPTVAAEGQPGSGAATQRRQLDALDAIINKQHGHQGRRKRHLTPREIARQMLRKFHWSRHQFRYLNLLWNRESGWDVHASNPYSGAYGIPQAVPGGKMASAGRDWWSSARTQIRWGLRYIKREYGSPERAWDHEVATGWY
jgi:hypothetical protein